MTKMDTDLETSDIEYDDYYEDFCDYIDPSCSSTDLLESVVVKNDPESIEFSCLDRNQVAEILSRDVLSLTDHLSIRPSVAKLLLRKHNWDLDYIKETCNNKYWHSQFQHNNNADSTNSKPKDKAADDHHQNHNASSSHLAIAECKVCCFEATKSALLQMNSCGHYFCKSCWQNHFEMQLQIGISTNIQCMSANCHIFCSEEFILDVLKDRPQLKAKYEEALFKNAVESHQYLRWCPGIGCDAIVFCKTTKAHRVQCSSCGNKFCMKCGKSYHAPTSCEILKQWMIKCADDSETANYISAHTKDCPNCHACIEKNGGCNHIHCVKCGTHFCWMCFRDWKIHVNEFYECSRYRENPIIAQEANHQKARRALERYLHYYERYENHSKSLKMEEELRSKLKAKIDEKVNNHEGTWIDWQYLHDAATLLTRCRYTLQYTYPFAYYMESNPRKELFEYQQAQLEKEIEELSWKVERAEHTDRGDLENQMHVAELKRRTLLTDFFD